MTATANALAQSPSGKTLIVGSEEDYPPFVVGRSIETAGGFTVELWQAAAKESGLNYALRVAPFHQILEEFKAGKIDVLINLAQSQERRQFAEFTVPHVTVNGAIFVRKDDSGIQSEADFSGKSIVVIKADLAHEYAVTRGWQKQLVLVKTAADGFKLLASGKHDAVLIGKLAGMQTMQELQLANVTLLDAPAGFSQKFSFAVRAGESELLARINEGLASTKPSGIYDALYEKWFGLYEAKAVPFRNLLWYAIPLGLVLVGLAGFFFYKRRNERKAVAAALRLASKVFEATTDAIALSDADDRVVIINAAFEKLTGFTAGEMVDLPWVESPFRPVDPIESAKRGEQLLRDGYVTGEVTRFRKDGKELSLWITATRVYDKEGKLANYVRVFSDISALKESQRQLEQLATHDALTDLPNRNLFNDRLNQAISHAQRTDSGLGVFFLDLDHFKYVNDGFGHDVGDALLTTVARELQDHVRKGDTVARVGGDEFAILLTNLKNTAVDAATIARKVQERFSRPLVVGERELTITPSIGISLYPGDGENAARLLTRADAAMYLAKEKGRNGFAFYTSEMSNKAIERVGLEAALRRALQLGQFELHYQPQVLIASGELTGMEALLRWRHPDMGLIPPVQFIPMAEETGLIVAIGEWVLRTACLQIRAWQEAGLPLLTVAVNLSALQLRQAGFVAVVAQILEETGLEPRYLDLEITESMVMGKTEFAVPTLKDLKALGIALTIDDFGTGYSNLGYLKSFPLDQIKIDRSFVQDLPNSNDAASIARAIVSMGHSLGLRVIPEGVETFAQARFLARIGCEHAQGFLYCKPLPAEEFAAWVTARATAITGTCERRVEPEAVT
ncbi:MAG: EAL domain-containing protein [Betaproteobacteria bacterium]|nr:EAL domain-containing protein [Betaproteobacteria bacterium]